MISANHEIERTILISCPHSQLNLSDIFQAQRNFLFDLLSIFNRSFKVVDDPTLCTYKQLFIFDWEDLDNVVFQDLGLAILSIIICVN